MVVPAVSCGAVDARSRRLDLNVSWQNGTFRTPFKNFGLDYNTTSITSTLLRTISRGCHDAAIKIHKEI